MKYLFDILASIFGFKKPKPVRPTVDIPAQTAPTFITTWGMIFKIPNSDSGNIATIKTNSPLNIQLDYSFGYLFDSKYRVYNVLANGQFVTHIIQDEQVSLDYAGGVLILKKSENSYPFLIDNITSITAGDVEIVG